MTYTVEMSEKQMRVVSIACELLARVGIGQLDFLDWLPLEDKRLFPHKAKRQISAITKCYTIDQVDGGQKSLGIRNEKTESECQIAWEIYQTFRHRLSWDRAVKDGVVESLDSPRKWDCMMGVNYDEPMQITDEKLPVIKR